jgi:Tol biopolymer transport system component
MTEHSRPVGLSNVTFDISRDGRSLVFAGIGGGGRDLYLLDLKSHRVTPLISSEHYEICPSFSPDGETVAFTRGVAGVRADQLCVINIKSGRVTQVTDADENVSSPVFLPDGKTVLCTVETNYRWGGGASSWDEGGELRIIDTQTREQVRLQTAVAPVFSPRISADGKWIAWIADGAHIARMSDLGKAMKVDPLAVSVSINGDGSRVAVSAGEYSPDQKIYVFNRAEKERRLLSGSVEGCENPVFSPDGSYVYFLAEEWPDGPTGSPTTSLKRAASSDGAVVEIASSSLFANPLSK